MTKSRVYATLLYFIFMFSAIFSINILQLIGAILYVLIICILDYEESTYLTVILSPSVAIVSIPWIGVSLLGIGSFILCVRTHVFRAIDNNLFFLFSIVFMITGSRLIDGNIFDCVLFMLVILTLLLCQSLLKNENIKNTQLIYSYRFGCLLMIIGMIFDYIFIGGTMGRFRAVADDCNYTAAALYVVFIISLISFGYSLRLMHNTFYLIISLVFGLSTGSRGFMLTVGLALAFFGIRGLIKRGDRKITFLSIIGVLALIVMYIFNVSSVVKLYDVTVGRTLSLKNSYSQGNFMDITSGRLFLWDYYWTNKVTNLREFLFGTGFHNYYLTENGGYGLAAHNMYISGIIGVGLIGLLVVIMLYLSFFKKKNIGVITNWVFLAIPIGIFIEYIMLDGLFDQRIIIYMLMASCLAVYINDKENIRQKN